MPCKISCAKRSRKAPNKLIVMRVRCKCNSCTSHLQNSCLPQLKPEPNFAPCTVFRSTACTPIRTRRAPTTTPRTCRRLPPTCNSAACCKCRSRVPSPARPPSTASRPKSNWPSGTRALPRGRLLLPTNRSASMCLNSPTAKWRNMPFRKIKSAKTFRPLKKRAPSMPI